MAKSCSRQLYTWSTILGTWNDLLRKLLCSLFTNIVLVQHVIYQNIYKKIMAESCNGHPHTWNTILGTWNGLRKLLYSLFGNIVLVQHVICQKIHKKVMAKSYSTKASWYMKYLAPEMTSWKCMLHTVVTFCVKMQLLTVSLFFSKFAQVILMLFHYFLP